MDQHAETKKTRTISPAALRAAENTMNQHAYHAESRFFLAPKPAWTDFERLRYLKNQVFALEKRLSALKNTPQPDTQAALEEEAVLQSAKQELRELKLRLFIT